MSDHWRAQLKLSACATECADGSCIQQTLADADALIGDLVIPADWRRIPAASRRLTYRGDSWRLQRRQLVRSELRSFVSKSVSEATSDSASSAVRK